jgi:hypothetical protein
VTLVEFIAPLKGGLQRDIVLAVLFYKRRYDELEAMTVDQIRSALVVARVQKAAKINVADILVKSGHFVDTPAAENGKRLWKLTDSGDKHVREILNLPAVTPEVENDVASLSTLASKIKDQDVRGYIEEALLCLRANALRAAIVFLWVGAIRTIQQKMLRGGAAALNSALQRHDPKSRNVAKIEDFAYVKDKIALLAAQDMAIIDKSEKGVLEQALDLRNSCGHPTKYRPGVKKASSLVEDIVGIVFS